MTLSLTMNETLKMAIAVLSHSGVDSVAIGI